jgi:hypothetical protein
MGRKPRVDRSPEEKWQIVQEGNQERERLGDVPASRDRSESVLSLEG